MALIKFSEFKEGEIFNKYLHSRLIRNNKNVLGVELGATGSGKSYRDLKKAELWYKYHFKEGFPTKNICFGVTQIMERLTSDDLRRGEILIFEEAGANLGALDFQNKVSKMFTYVLQSFRSMNIAIFFNLPYLSMLNKTARLLLHYSFESAGIDFEKGLNICKPKFHQVNQNTGVVYRKYMFVSVNGTTLKAKRFSYSMPSEYLVRAYESKKRQYLAELTSSFLQQLRADNHKELAKDKRTIMTPKQVEIYDLLQQGLTQLQIADRLGKSASAVHQSVNSIRKKGYEVP